MAIKKDALGADYLKTALAEANRHFLQIQRLNDSTEFQIRRYQRAIEQLREETAQRIDSHLEATQHLELPMAQNAVGIAKKIDQEVAARGIAYKTEGQRQRRISGQDDLSLDPALLGVAFRNYQPQIESVQPFLTALADSIEFGPDLEKSYLWENQYLELNTKHTIYQEACHAQSLMLQIRGMRPHGRVNLSFLLTVPEDRDSDISILLHQFEETTFADQFNDMFTLEKIEITTAVLSCVLSTLQTQA